ncbi:hypothetical protein JCM10213_004670 [Rhodosporidiobolus nylandii]
MSRRDDALQAVDSFVSSLRSELAGALADGQQRTRERGGASTPGSRIASRISRALDLPAASSPQNGQSGARSSRLSLERPQLGRPLSETPFAAASHEVVPLPSSAPPTPGLSSSSSRRAVPPLPTRPSSSHHPSAPPPLAEDADGLPSYSLRAPVSPHLLASLPPKRLHKLTSKSGKLVLELQARGREQVVLIQEVPDGETKLDGRLKVVLKEPEGITHVRARIKGVIRTMVVRPGSSDRHSLTSELTFLSSGKTLWTSSPSNGSPPERLRGNLSSDPTKLHGSFTFPFSLPVPGTITHLPPPSETFAPGVPGEALPRPIRPPPSFIFDPSMVAGAVFAGQDGSRGMSADGTEASCKYYLKITVGRRGMFKMNERWIVPLVFVPRQPAPQYSPLRELALRDNRRPPSSIEDPAGWTEQGKYLLRESVKRGMWKTKTGWVEVEGRVVKGKIPRGTGEKVEFEVQITTSNPEATGRFSPSSLSASLIQRITLTAQRQTNVIDTPLRLSSSARALGPPNGESVQLSGRDGGGTGWRVAYSGSVKLTQAVGCSFTAPNLAVTYALCLTVSAPSSALSPTQTTRLASLLIPISIASCAPRASLPPPPPASVPARPEPSSSASALATPPPPPPRAPPPNGAKAGPPSSADGGAGGGQAQSLAVIDEEAERRMEEEWGMPPSYFDVVEQGERGRG